jgi:hypothetical protein
MRIREIPRARITQAEVRLPRWMIVLGLLAVLASLLSGRMKFASGLAAGAFIAIVGYIWLQQAVLAALSAGGNQVAKGLVFKLVIRYPLLLSVLYLFYRTKWLPVEAVLAGFFVPLAGAVVECLYQLGGVLLPSRTRSKQ